MTQILNDTTVPLLAVDKKGLSFSLCPDSLNSSNDMWYIIKHESCVNGCELKEGDLLKLGRVLLKVNKINYGSFDNLELKIENLLCDDIPRKETLADLELENSKNPEVDKDCACKICCCDDSEPNNPLISPCKCTGSMRLIHVECLRRWLKSKISSRSSGTVTSYFWSDFSCELCKSALPNSVRHNGRSLDLISINYPSTPYMVLEDIRPDGNECQILHLVDLGPGMAANLGRGHDCDIRLSDISVSRNHARLRFTRGKFYIQDNKSKFGTLLNAKGRINLELRQSAAVQVNRTMIKVTVKKPCGFKSICCCGKKEATTPLQHFATTKEFGPEHYK